jgi:hypothetical protein
MLKLILIILQPFAQLLGILITAWQNRAAAKLKAEIDRQKNAEIAQRSAAIAALDAAQRRDDNQELLDKTAVDDLNRAKALAELASRTSNNR